jgi:hypothetical protein
VTVEILPAALKVVTQSVRGGEDRPELRSPPMARVTIPLEAVGFAHDSDRQLLR